MQYRFGQLRVKLDLRRVGGIGGIGTLYAAAGNVRLMKKHEKDNFSGKI